MLLHLVRTLRDRFTPWRLPARKRRPGRRSRLKVEALDDRTVPSTVTWTNPAGGDWDTPGNWSGGAVPGAGDDAVINVPGAVAITHAANVADSVHSVSAANSLALSAGSLAVSATLADTSAVILGGGTLADASVAAGTVLQASAGTTSTLQDVTLAGELDVTTPGATVNVAGASLTLAGGTANVGTGADLAFGGTQTLGAAPVGTVTLSGGSVQVPAGSALTLGAGVTVHGAGTVGSGGAVTNDGTLASDAGGLLVVQGATNLSAGTLTGGAWQAVGNSTLELPGAAVTTNAANVRLDGAGAILASDAGLTNALANLAANTAAGTLSLRDGALFATGAATFTNAGTVNVGAGSIFAAPGYTQTGGTTTLQGGTVGALPPPEHTDLTFDGSQTYVSAPSAPSVSPTSQVTVEAWVNPSSLSSPEEGIAGTWDDRTGNNRTYLLWVEFGHLAFYVSHSGAEFPKVVSTTALQPGHWYRVAGTFDGTSLRLYVNGALEATTVTPGPINTNNHPFTIGRTDAGGSQATYFPGQIADVRLWDVARSQADIRASMNSELTGSEPGLVGYWPLDDGSGTVAVDRTGDDDGTLSSHPPVWTAVAPGTVNGQGGTLSGTGTVAGSLTNAADLDLGPTAGTLNVEGGFTQTATGTLALNVGGAAPGSYDQLNVAGAATLGGTLNVTLTNGFAPLAGQTFHVLTAASAGGAFAAVNLPTADGVTAFTPEITATGFDLVGATVPPTSLVGPLPALSPPTFTVSWFGQDNIGGSGLAYFDVYVSDNGGAFTPLVLHTTQTSATFAGQRGHTYGFYSVATDDIGNRQATPAGAQASTTVPLQVATSTALTSGAASGSTYGQAVTFTATVSAAADVFGPPTGSVQFAVDGVNLGGPVPLSGNTASLTTTALAAGARQVTATFVASASDFANSTGGPLTQNVAQAALTVTADSKAKVYGAALPDLTGSVSGLVNGDDITASFSTTATSASGVGSYDITATLNDPDGRLGNYSVTSVPGTLTVAPATLTVTADNKAMSVGGPVPPLTASYSGFGNGDTAAVLSGAPALSTPATSSSPPGTYPICAAPGTLSAANYTFAFVNGTLTVTGSSSSASTTTAVTTSAAPSTYGDSVTFTATATATSTPTGSVSFVIDSGTPVAGTVGSTTGTTATWTYTTSTLTAGTHTVEALFVGTDSFTDSNATLSGGQMVNKANATVVVTPYTVTYDGYPHTATVTSITGVNGETGAAVGTVTLNTTHTNAGTYASDSWSFTGTANYNNIASTTVTETINKAALTITANNDIKAYGTLKTFSSNAFTQTGLLNGDTITGVTLTSAGAAASAAVGSYDIVASAATGTGLSNYAITYVNGTLLVGNTTSQAANFNGTAIQAGNYIWFSSVISASGLSSTTATTIWFVDQSIAIGSVVVPVPNASITFHPGTGTSATKFTAGGWWQTDVYLGAGLSGNQFLSGLGYYLPSGLAGGTKNVTWSGFLFTDQPGVSVNWKWAAAVYTGLPSVCSQVSSVDYNAMAIKPVDDTHSSVYQNSDHAGTPEGKLANGSTIKSQVTGGGTGGGGSNYTGGYSGTLKASPTSALDDFFIKLGWIPS